MSKSPVLAILVFLAAAHAQPAPVFDAASVKVSNLAKAGGEGSTRETLDISPVSLSMRNVTLAFCVDWAYNVNDFQLIAPAWFRSERYDIVAKASAPASHDQLRLMLQALLAERFKLSLRHETKDLAVYALVVDGKGPKLQPPTEGVPSGMRPNGGALEFRNMSMAELAGRLSARPFSIDRPVIDKTGLPGTFDFSMKLAASDAVLKSTLEQGESEGDRSLFTSPLRQLGLKLDPRKGPVEVLVIDDAQRVPTDN